MSFPESASATTADFEIWQRGIGTNTGVPDRRVSTEATKQYARKYASDYNAEEAENARMERRPVKREFFVVKVTSTRKMVA